MERVRSGSVYLTSGAVGPFVPSRMQEAKGIVGVWCKTFYFVGRVHNIMCRHRINFASRELVSRAFIRRRGNHMRVDVNNNLARFLTREHVSRLSRLCA